ncbi:hypothetical protein LINPERHAP2_LOCUS22502 [Linum perenne]
MEVALVAASSCFNWKESWYLDPVHDQKPSIPRSGTVVGKQVSNSGPRGRGKVRQGKTPVRMVKSVHWRSKPWTRKPICILDTNCNPFWFRIQTFVNWS